MTARKGKDPCIVCNPEEAGSNEYCDKHREELHRLDHQYEALFRLVRTSRGRDHEAYNVFVQGACDPCGRILVTETDPENLFLTVLLSADLDLDVRIADYSAFGISRTYGDQLRERIRKEIIHSWYGNARACIDIFRTSFDNAQHWDIDPREDYSEEESPEVGGGGG
ncbi:MAG: hypothetical protein HXY20_13660, partial [Acidobacteria bacterium]|nr:hypothetical protein [Acidobacteriota bacterium]